MSAKQPSTNKAVEVITDINYIPAVLSSGAGDEDQSTNSNVPPQEVPNEDEDEERPSNDYDDDAVADDAVVADNATSNSTTGVKFCNAITNLNLVLFFVLGVFSDLDIGFVQAPGFQRFIALEGYNPVPGALCLFGGMLAGALLATFILIKFVPGIRISITATLQFIGALFVWLLPTPYNQLVGYFFMYTGMSGMQTVLMPLTFYYGQSSTASYVAGTVVAPLLGTALINLFDVIKLKETAYMIVLLSFPIISAIAFFSLNKPASTTTTATNEDSNNNENETNDIETNITGDNHGDKTKEEENNNENNVSKQLTVAESFVAFQEVVYRYLPFFVIDGLFFGLWNLAISTPFLVSSSFSYGGSAKETIYADSDKLSLATSLVTTIIIVLTIFSPLGAIISKKSPIFLWIPAITMIILCVLGSLGFLTDLYPPMPVSALYFVQILVSLANQSIQSFAPLLVGSDHTITKKYNEFQLQIILSIFIIVQIIVSLFGLFWLQGYTGDQCQNNYEDHYDGVSCTYFM